MADKSVRYAPEFKRQMVDLVVRGGRSPASLAKEFGPSAWTIALGSSSPSAMPAKAMAD